jgi:hypothetical protein
MKFRITALSLIGLCLALFAACVTTPRRYRHPETLVTPLSKLMICVQGLVRYPDSNHPIADDHLIIEAKRVNPEFSEAFAYVNVLVRHDPTNVVLLVCPTNRTVAWLEDASWTPGVDKYHFQSNPPSPAHFTISLP